MANTPTRPSHAQGSMEQQVGSYLRDRRAAYFIHFTCLFEISIRQQSQDSTHKLFTMTAHRFSTPARTSCNGREDFGTASLPLVLFNMLIDASSVCGNNGSWSSWAVYNHSESGGYAATFSRTRGPGSQLSISPLCRSSSKASAQSSRVTMFDQSLTVKPLAETYNADVRSKRPAERKDGKIARRHTVEAVDSALDETAGQFTGSVLTFCLRARLGRDSIRHIYLAAVYSGK